MPKLLFFFSLLCVSLNIQAGELVLDGIYRGTNLYIQNPRLGENEFCVKEVFINGEKSEMIPKATAFDINLSHLEENTAIRIRIIHHDGCIPKVINPNAIKATENFQFGSVEAENNQLKWKAKGEKVYGKYFIMRLSNNKWETESVLECKGTIGENVYQYNINPLAGLNTYRIKYLEISGRSYSSKPVDYTTDIEKVSFYPKRVSSTLNFSREVKYQIRDAYGKLKLEGLGNKVACNELESGLYYVTFENSTEKFFKK